MRKGHKSTFFHFKIFRINIIFSFCRKVDRAGSRMAVAKTPPVKTTVLLSFHSALALNSRVPFLRGVHVYSAVTRVPPPPLPCCFPHPGEMREHDLELRFVAFYSSKQQHDAYT